MRTIATERMAQLAEGSAGALTRETVEKLAGSAPPQARTLEVIGAEIRDLKSSWEYTTIWHAVEIGRRLTEAKYMAGHGGWLPFLKETVGISATKAENLMKVFRAYGSPQASLFGAEIANSHTYGNLSYSQALVLADLSESERDAFVEVHDVDSMSTRELKEAIRERDEARRALDDAEKQTRMLRESADKENERANSAELKAERLEAEMKKTLVDLNAAASDAEQLRAQVKELESRPVDVAVMSVDQEAIDKAKAEAVAEVQAKLDKAVDKAAKAEEKRKSAEEALAAANEELAAAKKQQAAAAISNDKDLANFELLFQQAQEKVNVMHGVLLKIRGRGDEALTGKLQKALCALADAVRRCAE